MRAWLVIVPLVMLLVLELAVVLIFGVRAQINLLAFGKQSIERVGDRSIDSAVVYLQPAELAATVTSELIEGDVIALEPASLEGYLPTELRATPQVAGAYVGMADGSFVYLTRVTGGFRSKLKTVAADNMRHVQIRLFDTDLRPQSSDEDRTDTYDPRTRPWYDQAAKAQKLVLTSS
jgi:hypothetical protein